MSTTTEQRGGGGGGGGSKEDGGNSKNNNFKTVRVAGESILGPEFIRHFAEKGLDPYEHIPRIEVSIKVTELSRVFERENTFHATFCVQLDWEDLTLPHGMDVAIEDEQHFLPRFEILNCGQELPEAQPGLTIRRKESDRTNYRVSLTEYYKGDLLSRVNVADFPYDLQHLEICIRARAIHNAGGDKFLVQMCDPTRFRWDEGE